MDLVQPNQSVQRHTFAAYAVGHEQGRWVVLKRPLSGLMHRVLGWTLNIQTGSCKLTFIDQGVGKKNRFGAGQVAWSGEYSVQVNPFLQR